MRYYFDLDETLCLTPASRDYSEAVPLLKVIQRVNQLYDEGHEITIHTSRGGTSGIDYGPLSIFQLNEWGVKYHYFLTGKHSFDRLVDDKAISTAAWRMEQNIRLVGFLASCFDLLHAGHCLILKEAKERCDHVIAALQTDPTIDRPSKNQPIQSLEERRIQLEGCKYVDEIVQYDTEADLTTLLKDIRPDIRFLGSDNQGEITGKEYCGVLYFHDRSHNYSSSELRQRILDGHQ